ncbi:glycosyltransferase [Halalkalibacter lacteus]|uniref:glycosyltransferase n=1 Tax=Halalkalibacter lacteus TaxID=3090663 RepID=UPI002FC9BD08
MKIGSIENPKILFFTPYYKQNRGNSTTAKRLVEGFKMWDVTVRVFAYEEDHWDADWEAYFNKADIYHALHLKRFATWFKQYPHLELRKPYILTTGGTDVNEDLKNNAAALLINSVADESCGITVFNDDGKNKIVEAYPALVDRIYVIAQSVYLPTHQGHSSEIQQITGYPKFLLPAGLRPIKDVFYLWDGLTKIRSRWPDLVFTIVGPVLDEEVYKEVKQREKENKWFQYIEEIPLEQMRELYWQADIVLNTSISEGQPSAILEAMSLGKLVAVRNNSGNASIIQDDETGLLFESPKQFHDKVSLLLQSEEKQVELMNKAQIYVNKYHSLEEEMNLYLQVYTHCLAKVYS